MSDSKTTMTRYLLGELPEAERTALEQACFDDPLVFAGLEESESDLIDDYVRGRLAPELRRRFEQIYLTDAQRRQRVAFAKALIQRLDGAEQPSAADARTRPRSSSGRSTWLQALAGRRPAFQWSLAMLMVVVVSGALWFAIQATRSRQQAPAFVTLALSVGPGGRSAGTDAPVTLRIPEGTNQLRLALSLQEHDHPRYRVILRMVGGAEILKSEALAAGTDTSGAVLSLALPASHVPAGDYMLTLQGETGGGFEDLSQSLFRVLRK